MIHKKYFLNSINPKASKESYLETFLYDDSSLPFNKRPAMLVVPGGAYFFVAPLEGENVALRYMSEGFNCFLLSYAVKQKYPQPHIDLSIAVEFIKTNKELFNLDDNLFMVGFSAGGHLVASYSYLYKNLTNNVSLKPTGVILCYPVISMVNNFSPNVKRFLLENDESLVNLLSVEKNITSEYPPTFIWTTEGDTQLNPSHTHDMVNALKKNNVLHECHIYGNLDHGQSVVTIENKKEMTPLNQLEKDCKQWVDNSIEFIINNFYKK